MAERDQRCCNLHVLTLVITHSRFMTRITANIRKVFFSPRTTVCLTWGQNATS